MQVLAQDHLWARACDVPHLRCLSKADRALSPILRTTTKGDAQEQPIRIHRFNGHFMFIPFRALAWPSRPAVTRRPGAGASWYQCEAYEALRSYEDI